MIWPAPGRTWTPPPRPWPRPRCEPIIIGMASLTVVPFAGWARNLRLASDHLELIITLDVGPRVLALSRPGNPSVFKVVPEQAGGRGEAAWQARGGHRLWLAPEAVPFTYH